MDKKALTTGRIALIVVLIVSLAVFLTIMGIVIFGDFGEEPEFPPEEPELPPEEPEFPPEEERPVSPDNTGDSDIDVVFIDDGNLEDDENFGRCIHTWPDGAGEVIQGIVLSEEAELVCGNHVTQVGCESVDIFHAVGNTFLLTDGIIDCVWN